MSLWQSLPPAGKVEMVRKLAGEYLTATEIADELGTRPQHVRALAYRHDIFISPAVTEEGLPQASAEPTDMSETEFARKMAAWRRQVEGARTTREQNSGRTPVEISSTLGFAGAEVDNVSSSDGRFASNTMPAAAIETRNALAGAPADANASVRSAA